MKARYLSAKEFSYFVPMSLVLGALFASIQDGNWIVGFISFSFLLLPSLILLTLSYRWANGGKTLAIIVALAFALRLIVGVSLYLGLPVYGHEDEDDKAGFVFTDAHRRDAQAWELASSERPILVAFTDKFAYDQYGGLLAFSALIYRYLSPDAHRPLMLVLLSAVAGALGTPFLRRAAKQTFGERVALASAWIFALYPESILLGSSAMREPYILMFSAFALWGFVALFYHVTKFAQLEENVIVNKDGQAAWVWLGIGLLGMLLVSPALALATLIIFAGWIFFTDEHRRLSWKIVLIFAVIFIAGLLFLSASLNRSGQFDATSPLHVINDWLRLAVKWDAYQLKESSGWVQKIFNHSPAWIRLPFVTIYGIFQPVLPAALIAPTKLIWKIIYVLRSLGWYAILPMLIMSFFAGTGPGRRLAPEARLEGSETQRNILKWLSLLAWIWVLLAALRAGGDSWDNPRYRTMLFVWQAIIVGYVWVWWRETGDVWFVRVVACEFVFMLVFTQWYASRYISFGGQLPFAVMILLILGLWIIILGIGWWRDKKPA